MAAPMTKLLFLFLLGVTSWSRYVTANTVTLTECTADVSDGNGLISSMDCDVEDNMLKANMNINGCLGVPQLNIELMKDGVLVTTGSKSVKDPKGEVGNLCGSVDVPPDEDSCSMGEGPLQMSACDIESYLSDNDPGKYDVGIEIQADGTTLGNLKIAVQIE